MTPEDELARVMAIGFPTAPKVEAVCPGCNGAGKFPSAGTLACDEVVCATCGGAGMVTIETPIRPNA